MYEFKAEIVEGASEVVMLDLSLQMTELDRFFDLTSDALKLE